MRDVKKKGQFNFVWIFAILAGGTILVLAIYGAVQTGDTLRYGSDTAAAKSISILTDPLQAGFAEGSFGKIIFRQETRINNICLSDDKFGRNEISVATRSGVGEAWNPAGKADSVNNKYIFSEERSQGFDFYVFSKPFEFPYEVSDLVFMSSERFCFVNAPEEIEDEVLDLGIENIFLEENCGETDERVCFGSGGSECNMLVVGSCLSGCDSRYDYGFVSKNGADLHYTGNLIWGAIFAEEDVYDCNVERLMFRTGSIAKVLSAKADLMNARECGTNLDVDLSVWSERVENSDLSSLRTEAERLNDKNDRELCGVW